ncbi:predicted protein [Sparassis crispa]|uniref:Uncharacterized protein n=1 Tax=Sparassis crispa TaxID=139825 RepID=A0A401GYI3_9APHY|nr:predicted protein [Sparassis crispa]GBE87064.1 predicted protein [Sparassis crispa]
MELAGACDVYTQELWRLRYGYPLWDPELAPGGEVRIGDVGFIHEGAFHRFFNTLPDDMRDAVGGHNDESDVNPFGLPDNFEPFYFGGRGYPFIDKRGAFLAGPICSRSVKKLNISTQVSVNGVGGGLKLECSDNRGAALIIKEGADKKEWMSGRRLTNYIRKNHNSWYDHTIGHLDLKVPREDIVFVTGWVKTAEWAMAAFVQGGRSAQLTLSGSFGSNGAFLSSGISSDISVSPAYKMGPSDAIQQSSSVQGSSAHRHSVKRNQCIFLRYYKTKRRFLRTYVMQGAAEPRDPSSPRDDDNSDIEVEHVPSVSKPFDPAGYVLDYILKHSEAEIAIASDSDIYALCKDEEIPDDIPEFLERVQPQIEITEDGLGILSFDELAHHESHAVPPAEGVPTSADDIECHDTAGRGLASEHLNDHAPDAPLGEDTSTPETEPHDVAEDKSDSATGRVDAEVIEDPAKVQLIRRQSSNTASLILRNDDNTGGVRALAYSGDGKYVATGSAQFVVVLWNAINGENLRTCVGHNDGICAVAFSPDSKELASGSRDKQVMIWDIETGSRRATLIGHDGVVNSVIYSPDGRILASASIDCTIRLWDAATGAAKSVLEGHNAMVMHVAFSPDSRRVASAGADYSARIWSTVSGDDTSHVLHGHTGVIYSIAFSPDNRRLVTGSEDGSSRIWSAESGAELVILHEHTGCVWSAVFSPDGKRVLSVASDGVIKVCDSFSGDSMLTQEVNEGFSTNTSAGAFSVDTSLCATATDTTVRLWSTETGTALTTFEGHSDNINHLWFSPDGDRVVSSSDDSTFRLWSLRGIRA